MTGYELKEFRKSHTLNQETMSRLLGLSKRQYQRLERSENPIKEEYAEALLSGEIIPKEKSQVVMECRFDALNLSFPNKGIMEQVLHFLGITLSDLEVHNKSRYFYDEYFSFGHINFYRGEQGFLLECTGQGCRELELIFKEKKEDWRGFISFCVLDFSAKCTRIDLALDEKYKEDGTNFDLRELIHLYYNNRILTASQSYSFRESSVVSTNKGSTLYFGSRQSSLFFRFYEKDWEQAQARGVSVDEIHQTDGFKNRFEIVLRKEKSDSFINEYLSDKNFDVSLVAVGIINQKLTVLEAEEDKLHKVWYDLMTSSLGYAFVTDPQEVDFERKFNWFKSIAPSLKMLSEADGERTREILETATMKDHHEKQLYQFRQIEDISDKIV